MDGKQRLSVLLDDPAALASSLMKVARVVAHVLEEHPTDVAQKVRYGGGIIARDVAAPYAREIARGLAALGLGSFLVETGRLAAPPRPRRVGQFEFGADGVVIAQRLRQPEQVPWSRVLALHAHASLDPTSGEEDDAPARRGGDMTQLSEAARGLLGALREFEDRERARVVLGVDVLLEGPTIYRMSSTDPGIYGALPERSTIALDNYLSLVRALVAAAPEGVLVPPSTRRFAQSTDFTRVLFAKREELEAVNTWLLAAADEGLARAEAEPEDLPDEGLEDADEAIPLGPEAEADDGSADEIEDEELEDDAPLEHSAYDEASGDDMDAVSTGQPGEGRGGEVDDDEDAADDPDIAAALELFAQTGRMKASDVQAILAEAQQLDAEVDAASADPDADPEVKETLGFFDTNPSGRWDVKEVLEGADAAPDELDPKDG
ncbi:MAG: hypothetical protein M9894_17060 [Planctomycetes bacterium]|nr:hypothetical protein [Planctomycetota bacterium]